MVDLPGGFPSAPTPANPAVPGATPDWQTPEFWLTLLAVLINAVLALIPHDNQWAQILAIAGAILAQLGYSVTKIMARSHYDVEIARITADKVIAADERATEQMRYERMFAKPEA